MLSTTSSILTSRPQNLDQQLPRHAENARRHGFSALRRRDAEGIGAKRWATAADPE
jgi:hypothetical protein